MTTIYLDGKYIKVGSKLLAIFTPGIFKARGVFETMLALGGHVMDAALHLKRTQQGLKVLGIKLPLIKPSILTEVVRRNRLSTARVRVLVWQEARQVHVLAMALLYKMNDRPYRVCLIKTRRPANARLANVKSLDYALFAQSFAQAQVKGFDEALLLNAKGHIFEASRANIFWVNGGVLYTPPLSSGCLNGITRQQVIAQAKKLKIPFKEKNLTPKILQEADHAFLTNSLIGIKIIEFP